MSAVATLDWLGCATFRLRLDDLVIFLDAYVDRAPGAPPTGVSAAEIDRADWIVVGHSHFDHLWGAERIAKQTGATIVGSYETVRIMLEQGVPERQLMPVAGGERVELAEQISVSVFPSQHSCIWSHARFEQPDEVCLGDLGLSYQERRSRLAGRAGRRADLSDEVRAYLQAGNQGARGDGGALVYRFQTPGGSLLFQDTCGYWSGQLPSWRSDVAILAAAGRGNIDGEPIQGSLAEFVAGEAAVLQPRRLILGHHDDWLPGMSIATNTAPIRAAVAARTPAVELVEMGYCAAYPIFDGLAAAPSGAQEGVTA